MSLAGALAAPECPLCFAVSEPLCSLRPSLREPSHSALSPRTVPSASRADPGPQDLPAGRGHPLPPAPGPARLARRTPKPGDFPVPSGPSGAIFSSTRDETDLDPGLGLYCLPCPPAKAGGTSVPHNARRVTVVQHPAGNRRCSIKTNQYAEPSHGRGRAAPSGSRSTSVPPPVTPPGPSSAQAHAGSGRRTWTIVDVDEVAMTVMTGGDDSLSFKQEENQGEGDSFSRETAARPQPSLRTP